MKYSSSKHGFTLVEMIVSLAIFSVVAIVALTALMSIMAANRKAQTLQSSITNLSYALEAVSREMRVGSKYFCEGGTETITAGNLTGAGCNVTDLNSDGAIVAFNSAYTATSGSNPSGICNLIFAYRFVEHDSGEGYQLEKAQQETCHTPLNPNKFTSIIDDDIVITGYQIKVSSGRSYPYAIMRISGYSGEKEKDKTYFDLQTTVSSRSI